MVGPLKIMRENRAKADAEEWNAGVMKRMDDLHESIIQIPLGPAPTPGELLMKYTEEAVERIKAEVAKPSGDPLLEASGLLRKPTE